MVRNSQLDRNALLYYNKYQILGLTYGVVITTRSKEELEYKITEEVVANKIGLKIKENT